MSFTVKECVTASIVEGDHTRLCRHSAGSTEHCFYILKPVLSIRWICCDTPAAAGGFCIAVCIPCGHAVAGRSRQRGHNALNCTALPDSLTGISA